jgi:hypothetical protein
MLLRSTKPYVCALGIVAFALAMLFAPTAQAQKTGPFASLSGSWSGTGTILMSTGSRERIRCRAQSQPDAGGAQVQLQLRCASDSYKFEMQSNAVYQNGEVRGSWTEVSRNVSGTLSGTASGSQINVRVDGLGFYVLLAMTTHGDKQTVSIRIPSGSDLKEVLITLARGSR